MNRTDVRRVAVTVTFLLTAVLILSACYGESSTTADPSDAHPRWTLHHTHSMVGTIFQGMGVVSCFDVDWHSNPDRYSMCRVVEGVEEAGQPGNWDVTFYDGDEQPIAATCNDLYFRGCSIIAPNGKGYENCHMYYIDGGRTYWCDYRTSYPFVQYHHNSTIDFVLHTFWDWGVYMTSVTSCAYGITAVSTGQMDLNDDFLVSCFDGPM